MKPSYDLVIIGSGGAGCAAALEAFQLNQNIVILTKGSADYSKTANAQGGIQAAIGEGDSPELHFQDTMKAGKFKSEEKIVRVLTESAAETIQWLENIGVQFDRVDGGYKLKKAGGVSKARVLSCGDSTGNKIIKPLLSVVKEKGISLQENTGVKHIRKEKDRFYLDIVQDGVEKTIETKAVVLATGGLLPKGKRAGLDLGDMASFPDGIGLAEQLQAEVLNADLTQYHPTGIILPKALRRDRLPETMRDSGARLLNKNLEEFVDPLQTRNIVHTAIVNECESGRGVKTEDGYVGVWFTTNEIDKKMGAGYVEKNYPKFYHLFLSHGQDLSKEPVLVYPIVHYSLGGVKINEKTETTVPGFFAAGETTWGVHGEERLMGNSLLDIFVFGRIAGRQAAQYIENINHG